MTTGTDLLQYLHRQATLHHRASTIDMTADLFPAAAEALRQCAGLLDELQQRGWAGSQHVGGLPRWHITPAGAAELERRLARSHAPHADPRTDLRRKWLTLSLWDPAAAGTDAEVTGNARR